MSDNDTARHLNEARAALKRVKSLLNLIFYGQCIPTELGDRLIKLLPRPEDDRVAVTADDALPATVEGGCDSGELLIYRHNMELAAHQDLYTVLRLIDQGRISVSEKTHVASAARMSIPFGPCRQSNSVEHWWT